MTAHMLFQLLNQSFFHSNGGSSSFNSISERRIWDERFIEDDPGCESWDTLSSGKISSISDMRTCENTTGLRKEKKI